MEGRLARRLGVVLLALALLSIQGTPARAASVPAQVVHVLVHFAAGTTDADHAAVAAEVGGFVELELRAIGVTRIAAPVERASDLSSVVAALASRRGVTVVEPDVRVHVDFTPNDPLWNTDPYVGLGQWGDKKILLDRARDLVTAAASPVTVAVIDTGVDAGHPDLAGVVLPGVTLLSSQSTGCNADNAGTDDNSHGTHVAGIIAADSNNAVGIVGIAPNARILPIKALDCTGSGSISDIAQAIVYATDHGARIVNISLGSSSDTVTLQAAVQYAIDRGVLVVAAAGNCGTALTRCLDTANLVEYPAAYPGVLGVGATAPDDSIAPFSTQGAQVGISAPGVRIVSTTPTYATYQSRRGSTPGYAAFSGTSQATPFVAGAAALLLGIDPTLTNVRVAKRLRSTADDLGAPGADPAFGAGRLDLLRAVVATLPIFGARYDTSFVPRSAASATTYTARIALTNTSRAAWSSRGTSAVKLSYHWLDAAGATVVWEGVRTSLPSDLAPGTTVAVDMQIVAPTRRGSFVLSIDLIREGVGWFSAYGVAPATIEVAIAPPYAASYTPLTGEVWMLAASPAPLVVTLTNTGELPWPARGADAVLLSYHWSRDGVTTVWDGARVSFADDVLPGETTIVYLPVVPPEGLARYTLKLDLVQDGVAWFSDRGVSTRDVAYFVTSGYGASYAAMPSGATVDVTLTNTGVRTWLADGAHPVRLSYHLLRDGNVVRWDGPRITLERAVRPGESVELHVPVAVPAERGTYAMRLDLVEEGVRWFSDLGIAPRDVPLAYPGG